MNSIIWNGVSSTTIQGLLISELPPITKPEMRIAETVIDGRDGSTIEELGYASYVKTVIIGLHGNFDINKVIKYFTGEGDVIFSNEPDKVYKAKICGKIDYTRLLRYRQASIPFLVQPFKYKLNEYLREAPTETASGTSIVVNDSMDANLKALKIYGKSTQNGTPTPSAPIDIVSVGDDGNINANIYGGNLYDFSKVQDVSKYGLTVTYLSDGGIKVVGTPTQTFVAIVYDTTVKLPKGNYFISGGESASGKVYAQVAYGKNGTTVYNSNKHFTIDGTEENIYISITTGNYTGYINYTIYPMLNSGTNKMPCVPYTQKQSVTFATSLRAIPVTDTSLATYTDANGQMWCADEIDLERGVYVQRVQEVSGFQLNRTESVCDVYRSVEEVDTLGEDTHQFALCTHMNNYAYNTVDSTHFYVHKKVIWIYVPKGTNINGLTVYMLKTPTETPLTDEQIAICKTLKSNEPTTTILNDENAYMMVEYFKPFEVFNEGLENSKPLMILKGSGTVEISVNGMPIFSYTFPDGENEVYIDSEKEDAYLDNVLKNRNMNGEFPILIPKTNKIEWSGDVESISILPRSRWL